MLGPVSSLAIGTLTKNDGGLYIVEYLTKDGWMFYQSSKEIDDAQRGLHSFSESTIKKVRIIFAQVIEEKVL